MKSFLRFSQANGRLVTASEQPVKLKAQLLLTDEMKTYPRHLPDGRMPDDGRGNPVPRR